MFLAEKHRAFLILPMCMTCIFVIARWSLCGLDGNTRLDRRSYS